MDGAGGLLLKLTHISLLRPWVLPGPGGGVGWICRSFHGPLIFKMGLWSGQSEVSEKYWPVRQRMGTKRLLVVTNRNTVWVYSSQCRMNILEIQCVFLWRKCLFSWMEVQFKS